MIADHVLHSKFLSELLADHTGGLSHREGSAGEFHKFIEENPARIVNLGTPRVKGHSMDLVSLSDGDSLDVDRVQLSAGSRIRRRNDQQNLAGVGRLLQNIQTDEYG